VRGKIEAAHVDYAGDKGMGTKSATGSRSLFAHITMPSSSTQWAGLSS
jgi:hypothetical protein